MSSTSIGQVRVTRGHMIAARMKHQGLAFVPAILLDFAHNDDVVAGIKSPGDAANEMRRGPFQQWDAFGSVLAFDAGKFICKSGGKLPRKMVLPGRKHIDCEAARGIEMSKIRGLPREAPKDKRGIE